jgi:2-phospho-L-lactate guanylyltransferase
VEASTSVRWRLLIPVRAYGAGKSRLRSDTADQAQHSGLVAALQADTLDAVLAAQQAGVTDVGNEIAGIYLITSDAGAHLRPAVEVLPDPGHGLNDAVNAGLAALADRFPDDAVLVLVSDLPSLRPSELRAVLDAAGTVPAAFVPDAQGSGTTMLAASRPGLLQPSFGPRSAQRHRGQGAVEVPAGPGARADVDTAADLRECLELGVGRHTSALLADLQPFI